MTYRLSAVVKKEDKLYVALCPELDVASQGKTIDEAIVNLREAIQLYLETADPSELQFAEDPPYITTLDIAV
ncbi:MAG: type II toxin-antitoxin system HicB family antitoxin [Elusimicrobia bacterium]|nr:type II toxin-antitoxin system HicB family antitoxin [Candidatus Obscuribacterium magneticum]